MAGIPGFTGVAAIGAGGLGVVYRATDAATGAVVAVKVLHHVSDHSVAWHRARRELNALLTLDGHRHVVRLLGLLELDRGPAVVMEYVPGGSVAGLIARRTGAVPLGESVTIARDAAAALAAAHGAGIVHRDVKPHNLLVDQAGRVKLCDFGVAVLSRRWGFDTATGGRSVRYASPEDLDDDRDVGPATDIYSLGATLLHARHGAPPTLRQRLAEWVPPPTADPLAAAFDDVLAACLHPDPTARPTAGELVERLAPFDSCPLIPVRPSAPGARSGVRPAPDDPGAVGSDATQVLAGSAGRRSGPARPPAPRTPRRSAALRRTGTTLAGVLAAVLAAVLVVVPVVSAGPAPPVRPDLPITAPLEAPESDGWAVAPRRPVAAVNPPLAVAARPPGLVALTDPSIAWPFGAVGECLLQTAAAGALRPVPCEQPHDLQRVLTGDRAAPADRAVAMLDARALDDVVAAWRAECGRVLPPSAAAVDLAITHPSPAAWLAGDGRFQCLVGLRGHRLVGDVFGGASRPTLRRR